ncbi:MAG: hypothetical protein JXB00_18255 [Bacteroidales bacterium]|nr:hypothetical protein [Bacteroidales bacterium]
MKKMTLTLVLTVLTLSLFSQDYNRAMLDGIDSLNHIKKMEDFQQVANYFERIADAEPNEWLPGYYAAYCYIVLSFREQDAAKKATIVNKGENLVNKILKIKSEESEIYALQGMLYQAFITLDYQNNATEYSMKAEASFDKAIELNPENPRSYYLKGMNLMYTPEAYGGGMKAACPLITRANELFENFTKANDLMPDWGKDYNAQLLKKCGGE